MRKRRLVLALGLAVAAGAGLVLLLPDPTARITEENFNRIQMGMNRQEVEAILGPPGDYTTCPNFIPFQPPPVPGLSSYWSGHSYSGWITDTTAVWISFDPADGRVDDTARTHVIKFSQGPFKDLIWRVERWWHRGLHRPRMRSAPRR